MLNVSNGPYQVPPNEDFRFHLMQDLKNAVPNYEQRQKLVERIYEARGGSGITRDELKQAISRAVDSGELDRLSARAVERSTGVY